MNLLKEAEKEPYPYDFNPLHSSTDLNYLGRDIKNGQENQEIKVKSSGRVMARRMFGKLSFYSLQDSEGSIQLYLDKKLLEKEYDLLNNLSDLGDLIGVEGHLKRTDKGELSIVVTKWTLLAKSLQPPPNKFHGLTQTGNNFYIIQL